MARTRSEAVARTAGVIAPDAGHGASHRRSSRSDKPRRRDEVSPAGGGSELGARPGAVHLRPRRSPRMIALGLLLACLGGLGAALLWQQFSHSREVVVVARQVAKGQVIRASDLTSTSIGQAPGVATVPASDLPTLIGKTALVDLNGGALLSPGSVGGLTAPLGDAQLGIKVDIGRAPVTPLSPGTKVQLVPVPGSATDTVPPGSPVEAIVVTTPASNATGESTVLDIAVAPADAARVAQLAARNQLTVVREGQG